jgi:hypothetical protein
MLAAAQPTQPRLGMVVQARGAGALTCATAFLPKNRVATENWIAGYWAGQDLSEIGVKDPVAPNADLKAIVGEVRKVCRDEPSSKLFRASLLARAVIEFRSGAPL